MRGNQVKVVLSDIERIELEKFISTGNHSVHLVNRAKIILELDESNDRKPMTQEKIAEKVGLTRQALVNVRKDFLASESVSEFLKRKKRETPPVEPKITGDVEAHIIALACGPVPVGSARWTLRLLADKCVELNYINSISFKSVHRLLKKHNLNLT